MPESGDNLRAEDSDDGGELTLEDNGQTDELLQLEENDNDSYDDSLRLEDNEGDSNGELQLEDNADVGSNGPQLEENEHDESLLLESNNEPGKVCQETKHGLLHNLPDLSISKGREKAKFKPTFFAPLPEKQQVAPMLLGVRVVISGLVSKPELNGSHGLAKTFDASNGRYGVEIDGVGGQRLALKPANLSPAPKKFHESEAMLQEEATSSVKADKVGGSSEQDASPLGDIAERHERALSLKDAGQLEEAAHLLGSLMETSRRSLGPSHPETLAITNNLSAMMQLLGKHSEAAPLVEEVVERRRSILGPTDASTINALVNYGSLLLQTGQVARSVDIRREVLAAREACLGRTDPSTLLAIDNLAQSLAHLAVEQSPGGEPPALAPLEESVALLTEELHAYIAKHGKNCADKLPLEVKPTASAVFDGVMKHPELGADIRGYSELIAALQAALM